MTNIYSWFYGTFPTSLTRLGRVDVHVTQIGICFRLSQSNKHWHGSAYGKYTIPQQHKLFIIWYLQVLTQRCSYDRLKMEDFSATPLPLQKLYISLQRHARSSILDTSDIHTGVRLVHVVWSKNTSFVLLAAQTGGADTLVFVNHC